MLNVTTPFFGILGQALCQKNIDDDKFFVSSDFKAIRKGLNSCNLKNMAGSYSPAMIIPEMPPPGAEEIEGNITNVLSIIEFFLYSKNIDDFLHWGSCPVLWYHECVGQSKVMRVKEQ